MQGGSGRAVAQEAGAAVREVVKWERRCKKRELRCKTEAGAVVQKAGAAVREVGKWKRRCKKRERRCRSGSLAREVGK